MYCGQMQMCVCVQSVCSWCLKDVTFYMMTLGAINHTHSGAGWKTRHCAPLPSVCCFGPHVFLSLFKLHHVGTFSTNRIQECPSCTPSAGDRFQVSQCFKAQIMHSPGHDVFLYAECLQQLLIYKLGTLRDETQ